jgi:hypothetical protein
MPPPLVTWDRRSSRRSQDEHNPAFLATLNRVLESSGGRISRRRSHEEIKTVISAADDEIVRRMWSCVGIRTGLDVG